MAKESIEEIYRHFEQSRPRQQTTSINSLEGKASEDSVGFTKEQLSFVQQDLTTRSVVITSSRLCDCGKIITQKTLLAGTCQRNGCNHFTCTECSRTCSRCKKTYCPDHIGNTTCLHCRPIELLTKSWKWFFDIGNERTEE